MADTHEVYEVVYKGVVYDVYIKRTDKLPELKRAKRDKPHELVPVITNECEECGSIMFNDVCMNKQCPTNSI